MLIILGLHARQCVRKTAAGLGVWATTILPMGLGTLERYQPLRSKSNLRRSCLEMGSNVASCQWSLDMMLLFPFAYFLHFATIGLRMHYPLETAHRHRAK
ncbi:hypothetical protein BKA64DRAFT_684073 [Cadophora sp. MPI-SDFR-AT-0126]|nr:hypothetical protein BKA64DRAFT_684073 [Leotiomycetes sp. MPI-SDFR-AT-0126]